MSLECLVFFVFFTQMYELFAFLYCLGTFLLTLPMLNSVICQLDAI